MGRAAASRGASTRASDVGTARRLADMESRARARGGASYTSAAPKPAGLAQPAPAVVDSEQIKPCPSWGNTWDAKPYDNVSECLIRSAANAAALKPAGLAAPAQEQIVTCDAGESFNRCP